MFVRPLSHAEALGPGSAGSSLAVPYANTLDQPFRDSLQRPEDGGPSFAVDPAEVSAPGEEKKRTQTPYVTGTSVLGLTYKGGVILASDMLGAYGSTKRYKSIQRLHKINDLTAIGASGELSDYQYLLDLLDQLVREDYCADDGMQLDPKEIFAYLTRVLYNRRNKFDPLWNSLVIGGLQNGKPFLGTVGMIGTNYTDAHIATGFGNHLARPLFRERHDPEMSEDDAVALIKEGLKVCYYRDKTSINKFQIANVTKDGVKVSEPFALDTEWSYKCCIVCHETGIESERRCALQRFEDPAAHAVGTW